jgi:membrane dipeptidase
MRRLLWAGALALLWSANSPARAEDQYLEQARAILAKSPVIDGHIDVPEQLKERRNNKLDGFDFVSVPGHEPSFNVDLTRLKAGGYGGVFWSVYVPVELGPDEAVRATLDQIDVMRRLIDRYPARMALVSTAADARREMARGKIVGFLGTEGGHSIHNSLGVLRDFYALGVRYMTLTHFNNTDWADSATAAPTHNGLAPFGRETVREMNRLGMLVDLSHVSAKTMADAIDVSAAPVIFSHSGAFALNHSPRNVPDAILARLAANGGVAMVNFYPGYVSEGVRMWNGAHAAEEARAKSMNPGDPKATADALAAWDRANPLPHASVAQVADHIDHIRKVAGIDHIGIGSDFDGIETTPDGLEDPSAVPNLFAELLRRGYSPADCAKIADGNILRALSRAEDVAARLQRERAPDETVFTSASK